MTLGFFPMLLLSAWIVDTEPWKKENIVSAAPNHSAIIIFYCALTEHKTYSNKPAQ